MSDPVKIRIRVDMFVMGLESRAERTETFDIVKVSGAESMDETMLMAKEALVEALEGLVAQSRDLLSA